MKEYPYIQEKKKVKSGICEVCKETKEVLRLEWRVDIFQGNCEFENICPTCLNQRIQREQKEQDDYLKKMEPVWEKQRRKREQQENCLEKMLADNNISVQKYHNGQWCFNGILDWWTTTSTAIHRKTRKRYEFSIGRPEEIISAILKEQITNLTKKG